MTDQTKEREMIQSAKRKLQKEKDLDPIEKLRLKCLERGAGGIKGIGRQFRIMDDDGSKLLSIDEFKKGCHDYGAQLTDEEVKQAFSQLDKDGSGNLCFEEFLVAMRGPISSSRMGLIEKAFKKMDADGSGEVTIDDLKGNLNVKHHPKFKSGEWTKDQCLQEYLIKFEGPEGNKDGKVTMEEFINYYAGVSASIDHDGYFDLMMRNCWKL